MCFSNEALSASEAFSSPTSPPPFMAGIAEVEIDKETGAVEMVDYAAVVDCGTVVNPALARVQVEGGIAQGIGMALFEDIVYNEKGKNYSNSFMQYKIPSRLDVGKIRVEFESSYEPTGPFGRKVHRRDRDQYSVAGYCKCDSECGGGDRQRTSDDCGESISGECRRIKRNKIFYK